MESTKAYEKIYEPEKNLTGLSPAEIRQSRKENGSNLLTQKKRTSFLRQYLASFGDPIIQILLAALALNVLFLFRDADWMEAAGIALAVFLATFVSTLSEYGSEAAFSKLMAEADTISCRVRRQEGIQSVSINDVVCGDLVLLQAGEKIPADGLIISGSLKVDQSALNGESVEVSKIPAEDAGLHVAPQDWDLLSKNQVFRGSVVDAGEAVMLVCTVGDMTFYGHMAREMQDETRESPLKIKLAGLAKTISRLGYLAAALIAFVDIASSLLLYNNNMLVPLASAEFPSLYILTEYILHALTLAITIVVVAVPEGLPMMITVVLSSNMLRMLKDQVMVRKLVGIETSGSLNILFTDKTGTLTQGKLSVSSITTGDGTSFLPDADGFGSGSGMDPLSELVLLSCYHNTGSDISEGKALGGNATDRAMLNYAIPLLDGGNVKKELDAYRKTAAIPFDSKYKYSAVELQGPKPLTLVKGAPEKLLSACSHYYDEYGNPQPFFSRDKLMRVWKKLTKDAVRVLVIAATPSPLTDFPASGSRQTNTGGSQEIPPLIFIGLVGIRDELRPEAVTAVKEVQNAGVQVVMITGDNRDTAIAISRGAGLLGAGSAEEERVLTSADLADMSDEEVRKRLPSLRVVARALPTDKSRLVRIAQEMDLVVGMTGDGINDAPALKKADVGFAMGDGTEVAKEAGDIVILDNNFSSIAKAILYGRTIFKSIRKFIVFQLTMNLCAVGVSLICPFFGLDTPITIIQMLWVNIIMDTLAGLAFAGEPPLEEYMKDKPKKRDEAVLNKDMIEQIVYMGGFTILLCILFLKLPFIRSFFHYEYTSVCFLTAFFGLFVFSGIFNSFNARTHRLNLTAHLKKNPGFIAIMAMVVVVQIVLIYFGGSLFRTSGLTLEELFFTLAMASLVIPADILRKIWKRMHNEHGAL